jgi:hypothetical protein
MASLENGESENFLSLLLVVRFQKWATSRHGTWTRYFDGLSSPSPHQWQSRAYRSQSWKNGPSGAGGAADDARIEICGCAAVTLAARLATWLPPSAVVKTRQPLTRASATRTARGRLAPA